jgi:hypothetical protein
LSQFNGGDSAELRLSQPTTTESASVMVEEETCGDEEQDHTAEQVHYGPLERGHANNMIGHVFVLGKETQ